MVHTRYIYLINTTGKSIANSGAKEQPFYAGTMKCLLFLSLCVLTVWAQESDTDPETWPGVVHGEPMPPQRPAGHDDEPLVRCKRPMCRMFCERGFHLDDNGCPECKCQEDPCEEMKCDGGKVCKSKPDCTHFPCREWTAECVEDVPCAMPMCADACEHGYKNNEHGCMTCDCKKSLCDQHPCPSNHECHDFKPPFCPNPERCVARPICIPVGHHDNFRPHDESSEEESSEEKSSEETESKETSSEDEVPPEHNLIPQPEEILGICHFMQGFAEKMFEEAKHQLANHSMLPILLRSRAMHRPMCHDDGSFHPRQCFVPDKLCWCVDDRGKMIQDSRTVVKQREDIPTCVPHKTVLMSGMFMIKHELEEVAPHIDDIKGLLHEHMSEWLMIKKEFIELTKVEAKPTKENLLMIEFTIRHDGKADFTSIDHRLRWHLQQTHGNIPYMETTLFPQPKTLKIEHEAEPMLPEDGLIWRMMGSRHHENKFMAFYHRHRVAVIAGGVAILVFLIVLIAVSVTACKRRASIRGQFKPQRLDEKSQKYKENLAFANEIYGNLDVNKEKAAQTDEQNQGEQSTE